MAGLFVEDGGWYATLCVPDHFGTVCGHARECGFKLYRTMLVMIPLGYKRKGTLELVSVR